MMTVYLFGFAAAACAPAIGDAVGNHAGLGRGVSVAVAGPVAVLWAEQGQERLRPTRRSLTGHARVLELAHAVAPVLPVAFGQLSGSQPELLALAERHAAAIAAELDRVGDRVEFGVRVSACRDALLRRIAAERPDWQRLPAGFEARVALGQAIGERIAALRAEAQAALLAALGEPVLDRIIRAPEDDCELLRADVLSERGREARLADGLDAAVRALDITPGLVPRVRIVGPSPAYAFVRLALSAPAACAGGV